MTKRDTRVRRCINCNAYLEWDGKKFVDLFGGQSCWGGDRHNPGSTG